jgi:hypothetical protein
MSGRKHEIEVTITLVEEDGMPEMYVMVDGQRIAKRGRDDHAMTWVPLEPGWVVRDRNYPHGIELEYLPVIMQ